MVQAVQVATFAAFVGAIGGLAVLIGYWFKRKRHLDAMLINSKNSIEISLKEIYKEILFSAFPFVIVGIAIPLFQLVDMLTFNKAMASIGLAQVSETAYATLNFNSHKIVIIPVSLATAFATALVPMITSSFVNDNYVELRKQLNQTFQVLIFLTLPATLGIMVLADPMYTFFYGYDETGFGPDILQTYAPVAILFAFFSVTAAILQGLNVQKFTIFSLLLGLLFKLILNIPFIQILQTKGAILATAIGYGIAIIINLFVIRYYARYRYRLVFRRSILIIIFTIIMASIVHIGCQLLANIIPNDQRFTALILVIICATIGAVIYFILSAKSKLLNLLFPDQVESLKRKLQG